MNYRKVLLGTELQFLLPSLKIRQRGVSTRSIEDEIDAYLTMNGFSAYTAHTGNISGTWRDKDGRVIVGEHRLYAVAFKGKELLAKLEAYIAELAVKLGEECIYCKLGGKPYLIYPVPPGEEAKP